MTAERLTIRTTADMADNLAVLAAAGLPSNAAAVRHAVALLADAYRYAVDYGEVPEGASPRITGFMVNGSRVTTAANVGPMSAER